MQISLDTFIISDTHFGHKHVLVKEPLRVITLNNTHYKSFDDLSLNWWNEVVSVNDSVLHLGDLYFGDGDSILPKLNGEKMLIVGNNDMGKYQKLKDWRVVKKIKFKIPEKDMLKKAMKKKWGDELKNPYATGLIVDVNNVRIMFSHFPVGERKKNDKYHKARDIIDYAYSLAKCEVNIHGHIHSRDSVQDYCINASTERLSFRPKRLRDILSSWAHF